MTALHKQLPVAIASAALAACSFDASGIAPAGDNGSPDAGAIADGPILGPCPDDVSVQLTIGGVAQQPAPPGRPYVYALLGDSIELSAVGSCAREGPISYEWQISPIDATRATAAPDLASETITVLPVLAEDYTVTLTVRGAAASASETVLGISARGWQRRDGLPGNQDIRALTTSADTLWIAHSQGAHALAIDGSAAPEEFVDLAEISAGEPIPGNLGSAYYSADDDVLWLARLPTTDRALRMSLGDAQLTVTALALDTLTGFGNVTRVHDISGGGGGVALATDDGLGMSDDGVNIERIFAPGTGRSLHATAGGPGGYVGGGMLYDIGATALPFDVFSGSVGDNNLIRALAVDAVRNQLWVGTAGHGVALVGTGGGLATMAIYNDQNSAIGTGDIRAIAVEPSGPYAGDVWAATDSGVARYVRSRDSWLLMGNPQGLQARLDVRALAIDDAGGRRAIYAGTRLGLVSMQQQQ